MWLLCFALYLWCRVIAPTFRKGNMFKLSNDKSLEFFFVQISEDLLMWKCCSSVFCGENWKKKSVWIDENELLTRRKNNFEFGQPELYRAQYSVDFVIFFIYEFLSKKPDDLKVHSLLWCCRFYESCCLQHQFKIIKASDIITYNLTLFSNLFSTQHGPFTIIHWNYLSNPLDNASSVKR